MTEREGVIKYTLNHDESYASSTPSDFAQFLAWREILFKLGWIGEDPSRYDGVGFGNVSARTVGRVFWVSGTQTSGLPDVSAHHFAQVNSVDFDVHVVNSCGPVHPSSESITHAMIYDAIPEASCVLHTHDPVIWRHAEELGLPCTPATVAYGTAQMSSAVRQVLSTLPGASGILAMLGHEDGIVAWGKTPSEAGAQLMTAHTLARSLELR